MSEETMIDTQQGVLSYLQSSVRIKGQHVHRLANGGMEMAVIVKGTVKGTSDEKEFVTDPSGHQFVNRGALDYTELSRMGQGWQTIQTYAVAGLVVRPSTVTGIEIWNGSSSVSLVIDRLFAQQLVTSTTGLGGGAQIWAQVSLPVVAGPSLTALIVIGNTGKGYNGLTRTGVGTTVVANGWFPWGPTVKKESAGAVVPGGGLEAQVNGRLIVPPYASLCVTVVSGYAADT